MYVKIKNEIMEKTISSQNLNKNGTFEIIRRFKDEKNVYKATIKCVKCGTEQTILATHINRCKCKHCSIISTEQSHIGEIIGCFKLLEFDHRNGNTLYYKVECIVCGKISIKSLRTMWSRKSSGCENCKGRGKVPTLEAPINAYYHNYKKKADERGLEFNLTKEEFTNLIFKDCVYCGSKPIEGTSIDRKHNKTGIPFKINGIDRVDSSKGYSINNCVPCCGICNKMKLDHSLENFKSHISKIYQYLNLGSETIESTSNIDGSE